MKRNSDNILFAITYLAIFAALSSALLLAPTEKVMGDVQRIFYFHLACAVAAFFSFTSVLAASICFLVRRETVWDNLAVSASEVGVLFTSFVLVTGPLWARPVWGQWWVWDPRLTTTLILWFLYVGYLILRQAIPGYRGAMAAAVFAILAYVDVPVVYFSVSLWRGIHPQVLRGGGGLDQGMVAPLLMSVVAFLLLSGVLIRERFYIANTMDHVDRISLALEDLEP